MLLKTAVLNQSPHLLLQMVAENPKILLSNSANMIGLRTRIYRKRNSLHVIGNR